MSKKTSPGNLCGLSGLSEKYILSLRTRKRALAEFAKFAEFFDGGGIDLSLCGLRGLSEKYFLSFRPVKRASRRV